MRLYYSPGSCALSPHIVAKEAGLEIELSRVQFSAEGRTTEQGEDYFSINPKGGYVPTLSLDNGEVLTEGIAIILYLASQAPGAHLAPDTHSDTYFRLLEWAAFISTELHKGFSPFFRADISDAERVMHKERLESRFRYVEKMLTGREYLLDTFTVADAYLYTILRWSSRADIDIFATYPALAAFISRMESRPGVKSALEEEGLNPLSA